MCIKLLSAASFFTRVPSADGSAYLIYDRFLHRMPLLTQPFEGFVYKPPGLELNIFYISG